MEGNREKLFLEIEKKGLNPLPERKFSFGEWKKAKVHMDYHIFLAESADKNIYDAEKIGPSCKDAVTGILIGMPRPGMSFRSYLGIIRLAKSYAPQNILREPVRWNRKSNPSATRLFRIFWSEKLRICVLNETQYRKFIEVFNKSGEISMRLLDGA